MRKFVKRSQKLRVASGTIRTIRPIFGDFYFRRMLRGGPPPLIYALAGNYKYYNNYKKYNLIRRTSTTVMLFLLFIPSFLISGKYQSRRDGKARRCWRLRPNDSYIIASNVRHGDDDAGWCAIARGYWEFYSFLFAFSVFLLYFFNYMNIWKSVKSG